jgi:hypothetical protein
LSKAAIDHVYDLCGIYCPDLPAFFLGKKPEKAP